MDSELAHHRGGTKRPRDSVGSGSNCSMSPKAVPQARKRRRNPKNASGAETKQIETNQHDDRKRDDKARRTKRKPKKKAQASQSSERNSKRNSLQHKNAAPLNEPFDAVSASGKLVLPWLSSYTHVPLFHEQEMVKVVIRWGKTEHGMMWKQPEFRVKQIKKKCHKTGMYLAQALSLRRHHIKLLNPDRPMFQLGLGKEKDVRQAAAIFENAVGAYLNERGVKYKGEKAQKQFFKNKGERMPPTPDFMMEETIVLKDNGWSGSSETQHFINWIEAKMFYGASTIPHDDKSAVGRILLTARKYVTWYGPGAMVFAYGCGEELARELLDLGVVALDAQPLDLTRMLANQRRWCANESGEILP